MAVVRICRRCGSRPATGVAQPAQPEPVPPKRSPTHYLWAVLIARIYEVFPLSHLTYPARGPPVSDECGDAQMCEGAQVEPDWATDWMGRCNRHRTLMSVSASMGDRSKRRF